MLVSLSDIQLLMKALTVRESLRGYSTPGICWIFDWMIKIIELNEKLYYDNPANLQTYSSQVIPVGIKFYKTSTHSLQNASS